MCNIIFLCPRSRVIRRLFPPQVVIKTLHIPQQLFMSASLHNLPVPQDKYHVRRDHGRQTVRYNQRGAVLRYFFQRYLDVAFRVGVKCRCCFVQEQDGRVLGVVNGRINRDGEEHSVNKLTLRKVRAIATRCFSPPLSRSPRSPTRVLYPKVKQLERIIMHLLHIKPSVKSSTFS
jgi:hypothetical protein